MMNAVAQTARQVRLSTEVLLSEIGAGAWAASNETLTQHVEILARELQILASAVAVLADAVDGADQ